MNILATITYDQLLEEELRKWDELTTSRDCKSVQDQLWDQLCEIRTEIIRRNSKVKKYN